MILLIDAGGNDDKTLVVREGLKGGIIGEEFYRILRRRLETLSEKNEAKYSARYDLGVLDGREMVCLRLSKEFMFSRGDVGWGLMTG